MRANKLKLIILSSLAVSSVSQGASAQTPAQVEQLVITASRTPQSLNSTLATIIVISRDEIDAVGNATLPELLQRKAGVEIRTTGGAGQPAGVFIRGANSQHTLVLVDGLRLGSATAGSPAFENIPLDLIERIEIVKGPFSSLYGSDAIGGVIQIFTRNLARPRLQVGIGFGTDSAYAVNAGTHLRNRILLIAEAHGLHG